MQFEGSLCDPKRSMISLNGSEHSRGTLPSLFTMKDITAHNSSDNGTHTIRNGPEGGETSYTSVSSLGH